MDFLFIGNNPAADFVNTEVISQQEVVDLINSPDLLSKWFEKSGCGKKIRCSEAELKQARELRTAIRRTFEVSVSNSKHAVANVADVNLLNKVSNQLTKTFSNEKNHFFQEVRLQTSSDIFALIAQNACELLASVKVTSLRKCASDECILYFVDTSKNQLRQWCSMEICGNRNKARSHYIRNKSL